MNAALSIVLGVASLISMGVTIFIAWMFQKARADQAELYIRISADMHKLISDSFERHNEEDHGMQNSEILRLRDFDQTFPNQMQGFLSKIETRIDFLLTTKAFDDFREVHDREITNLTREIGRLREFRHGLDAQFRKIDAEINDLKETKKT